MTRFAMPLPSRLSTLAVLMLLGGCGGGDGAPPPVPTQTSGYAVDGYLQGAAVLCDTDSDGQPAPGEVTVSTSSAGLFIFPEGCGSPMVVTGGKNADTGLAFTGTLKAAAGSKVVTPLTTLMAAGLSQDQLLAAFRLPADTDVANTDPALLVDGALAHPTLMKQTAAVQQLTQKTAEMLGGLQVPPDPALQPALYAEVAAAFAEHLQSGARLNLSASALDVAEIGNLVKAAALRVGAAKELPSALRNAVKAVNADAMAGVTAGGLAVQAEAILKATDAKNLTEVTKVQQSDTQITTYVAANRAALSGTPTAEAVNAMGSALTQQVKDSQDGGGTEPPPVSGTLIVSFDEATPAFSDMGAYGGALPSVGPAPAGGSGNALKILKPTAPDTWGGVYFTVAPIPFAADRKVITARVNATRAGAVIKFKVEIPGGSNVEVAGSPTGAANTWSTVSWDFSGVDTSKGYRLIAITPDADLPTSGQSYYIDTITLAPAVVTPPPSGGKLLLSFDESTPAFSDMGAYGGALPTVEAGPAGGKGNALKILKPVAPDTWGGTFFTIAPIPFTADRTMLSARVYATRAEAKIKLKVEVPGGSSVEVVGTTTGTANTWTKVKWDFGAVDPTKAYKVMAITPDADLPTSGQAYYIDDITLEPADTTPPPPPGATFVSFDESPPVFTDMGAYGGALPTVEAAPAGGTGNALKILKPVSPDTWGGVFFTTAKVPFTTANKAISARVYATRAGAVIKFKVEVPGGSAVEVASAPTGAANTWSTVTWDFSAVDLSKTYKIIAITPDGDLATSGKAYYIDDIKVVAATVTPPPAPVVIATLDEPGAVVTGFEGCWDSTLVPDPAGGTNKVGRVVKPGSGVPFYCGTTVVTVANGGFTPIPFTTSAKTVKVRVWVPTAGIPVRLKVEDIEDPAKSVEAEVNAAKAGWQTLSFNFASQVSGTPALDLGTSYTKATIFFKFGSVGTGETYYFDDVTFTAGGTTTALVTFDERNFDNTQSQPSVLNGFGGAEDSTVIGFADVGVPPDGAKTGKLAKVVKNPGEVWAGTSVQRKVNDAVPTIPFVTGATRMSVRVYSAYVGMRVHLKVEQSGRPDFNSEVDAFTSKVNTWETLVFDFGPAGKHFVPSGPGPDGYVTDPASPAYRPTSQLDVSKTFNKVNIFFDYGLGDAGYDAMPGTRTYYFDDLKFIGP